MQEHVNEVKDIYSDSIVINFGNIIDIAWNGLVQFWKWLLISVVIMTILSVVVAKYTYTPEYQLSTIYMVDKATDDTTHDALAAAYLGNAFMETLQHGSLGEEIAIEMGYESYSEIPVSASIEYVDGMNILTITLTSNQADIVQEVEALIDQYYYAYATKTVGSFTLTKVAGTSQASIAVNELDMILVGLIGFAIGIVLYVIFISVYTLTRQEINSIDDIRDVTNISCLAQLPKMKYISDGNSNNEKRNLKEKKERQQYKSAVSMLAVKLNRRFKGQRTILFTSVVNGEGRTMITSVLSVSLNRLGKKVAIVDMDFKDTPAPKSVATYLNGENQISEILVNRSENLLFVKAGMLTTSTLDESLKDDKFVELLRHLKEIEKCDYILIKSTPMMTSNDVVNIAKYVDDVVLIMGQGKIKKKEMSTCLYNLIDNNIKLTGYLFNFSDSGITGGGQYGKYSKYSSGKYGYGKYGRYGEYKEQD